MRETVEALAGTIGERNRMRPKAYEAAAAFLADRFRAMGYAPARYRDNIEAEIRGGDEIVIVGAHYDTVAGSPGADDNASGVAAMLEIARAFAGKAPRETVRFVAFANEEAPFFGTEEMGSLQYARRCRDRKEKVVAMLSLETIGYFSDAPRSQQYPSLLHLIYPPTANFIAFVSNLRSRSLLHRCVREFRAASDVPCERGALPEVIPGVSWSDQWSFWQCGYPAIMVTDTALFRNPHYHSASDAPETLDYDRLERVTAGITAVVRALAR
jgi:Zn-dependent M28 family amino/carboxypeptidase